MPNVTLNLQNPIANIVVGNINILLTNQSDNDRACVQVTAPGGQQYDIDLDVFPRNNHTINAAPGDEYVITYVRRPGNPDVLISW